MHQKTKDEYSKNVGFHVIYGIYYGEFIIFNAA